MTADLTLAMRAVFVLEPITILTTGVWQNQVVVIRLFKPTAVAAILGHLVLSVTELAVGTRPIEEGEEALDMLISYSNFFFFTLFVTVIHDYTSLLLFLIVANSVFQRLVELLNPAFDAAKMEGLAALLAIPEGATLVNHVVADQALLGALSQ